MYRKKLSEEEKQEIERQETEKRLIGNLTGELRDYLKRQSLFGSTPTRQFEVGDYVKYGNRENVEIIEKHADGQVYKVLTHGKTPNSKTLTDYQSQNIVAWIAIFPPNDNKCEQFSYRDKFHLNYYQSHLRTLFHKCYFFGVDDSPEYQRDYIWDEEDKVKLIDSIFNNIDIGKFLFMEYDFVEDKEGCAIVDGKQRLKAITDFYEGRFKYRGKYFHELCNRDKGHFTEFNVNIAEVQEQPLEDIMELFLKVNTGGRRIDPDHLKMVENRLKEIRRCG